MANVTFDAVPLLDPTESLALPALKFQVPVKPSVRDLASALPVECKEEISEAASARVHTRKSSITPWKWATLSPHAIYNGLVDSNVPSDVKLWVVVCRVPSKYIFMISFSLSIVTATWYQVLFDTAEFVVTYPAVEPPDSRSKLILSALFLCKAHPLLLLETFLLVKRCIQLDAAEESSLNHKENVLESLALTSNSALSPRLMVSFEPSKSACLLFPSATNVAPLTVPSFVPQESLAS